MDHEEPAAQFQGTSTVPVSEAAGGVRSQDPAQEFPDAQGMVSQLSEFPHTQGSQSPAPAVLGNTQRFLPGTTARFLPGTWFLTEHGPGHGRVQPSKVLVQNLKDGTTLRFKTESATVRANRRQNYSLQNLVKIHFKKTSDFLTLTSDHALWIRSETSERPHVDSAVYLTQGECAGGTV